MSNSRRESQLGPKRGREPKEPKEPREKGRHPILRFIGRTIATLICLGIMAGSLVAVGAVYYVGAQNCTQYHIIARKPQPGKNQSLRAEQI